MERGIGARGLRAVLEEVMSQIMYDIPSDNSIVEVDITPESVRDGAEPQLIRDPNRPPRPHLGAAPSGPRAAAWPARTVQPEGETIQFHATDRAEGETSPPFPVYSSAAALESKFQFSLKGSESVCQRKKRLKPCQCKPCPPWPCGV